MSEEEITFKSFDKFEREVFASRLTSVISSFYPFYDESYVLSLDAKFGCGKTTFLKMWKAYLQAEPQKYEVIYINAWETDFDDEPLIPILSCLMSEMSGKLKEKARKALSITLGATAIAGNHLLRTVSGLDLKDLANEIKKDNSNILEIGDELYKTYSFKKSAYETLKYTLEEYIRELDQKPLIIFVDELDRVRPDYAVKFLETIKHIFSIQGICFVIAVDKEQLKASVKQLYGEIDFNNYYLRFITREASLPTVSTNNLEKYIMRLSTIYFDEKREEKVKFAFKKEDQDRIVRFITIVCVCFKFTARQAGYLFRIFSQFMAIAESETYAKISWVEASIILVAFFIYDKDFCKKIGENRASLEEINTEIINLLASSNLNKRDQREIYTLMMSFLYKEDNGKQHSETITDLVLEFDNKELTDENRERYERWLLFVADEYGHLYELTGFEKIYLMFEEWEEFL